MDQWGQARTGGARSGGKSAGENSDTRHSKVGVASRKIETDRTVEEHAGFSTCPLERSVAAHWWLACSASSWNRWCRSGEHASARENRYNSSARAAHARNWVRFARERNGTGGCMRLTTTQGVSPNCNSFAISIFAFSSHPSNAGPWILYR